MTYLHKLAKRLAAVRLPLVTALVSAVACSQGDRSDFLSPFPNPNKSVLKSIRIEPKIAAAPVGTNFQFTATGLAETGEVVPTTFVWSAEGGIVSPEGLYRGGVVGPFRVIARAYQDDQIADTAYIAVWHSETDPMGLVVQPDSMTIDEGEALVFGASVSLVNGALAAGAPVRWSATGGLVDNSGRFSAQESGTYTVTATTQTGLRGQATVFVRRKIRLTRVVVDPQSARLAPGRGLQFAASGTWSDGRTGDANVQWSTNGGAISQAGAFTAGSQEGAFLVVGRAVGTDLADTSLVTVAADAPTLLSLQVTPKPVSMVPGSAQQFSVSGTWSDGSASPPAVTWSASGGTITNAGYYVAGPTSGTYRVIAVQQGGTKADTATVAINVTPPPPYLSTIGVSPKNVTVAPAGSQQFAVTATWSDGSTVPPAVAWSATGGSISDGLYTAGATPGTYRVVVAGDGKADTATVTVSLPPPATLEALTLSPAAVSIQTGRTQAFTASAVWSDGSTTLPPLSWSATGGTVSSAGLYTAGTTVGSFRVIVSGGGKADTSAVSLVASLSPPAAPGQPQFSSSGSTVGVNWSAGSGATSYRYTAGASASGWAGTQGTTTPTSVSLGSIPSGTGVWACVRSVNSAGESADQSCNAYTVPSSSAPSATLQSLTVSPDPVSLSTAGTRQFSVSATWSNGGTSLPSITWSATGGTINSSGFYTAGSTAGTYRVIASGGGKADTASVTLTAPTLTGLTVSPDPVSMSTGGTRQFSVSATWSNGGTSLPSITWSATGGTISSSGLYTAGATAGTFRVIASGGGRADTASVTLTTATVTSFVLSPASATVGTGATQQFQSSATWSDGVSRSVSVTYNATGGTISSGGLFTAGQLAGTFAVIASCSCGKADTSAALVTAPVSATLTSLALNPDQAALLTGATQQFTVSALWSNGGTSLPTLTWSATGGTVSSTGLYTAGGTAGTFRVIAVGGGKADTVAVTVSQPAAPPPQTGSYPNRPGNFTKVVADLNMSQSVPSGSGSERMIQGANSWSLIYDLPGGWTRMDDPTAASSIWQLRIPAGKCGSGVPGSGEGCDYGSIGTPLPGVSQIYISLRVRWDAQYEWHSISNKFVRLEPGNCLFQSKHNSEYLRPSCESIGQAYEPQINKNPADGQWHHLELLVVQGNPGTVKWWVDGELRVNHTNLQVGGGGAFQTLNIDSYMGGGGMTKSRDSYRSIDHIFVATP